MSNTNMAKGKRVGWRHGDDLYTASLILTEKPTRITIDITIEPLKPWQPSIRVSERVVRRRKPC